MESEKHPGECKAPRIDGDENDQELSGHATQERAELEKRVQLGASP